MLHIDIATLTSPFPGAGSGAIWQLAGYLESNSSETNSLTEKTGELSSQVSNTERGLGKVAEYAGMVDAKTSEAISKATSAQEVLAILERSVYETKLAVGAVEDNLNAFKAETDRRLKALEGG